MSYKISYSEKSKSARKERRSGIYVPIAAVFILLAAMLARMIYPAETKQITEALFPLTNADTRTALEVFAQNIKEGESFSDAVTAFCLEIIDEADIS